MRDSPASDGVAAVLPEPLPLQGFPWVLSPRNLDNSTASLLTRGCRPNLTFRILGQKHKLVF